MFSLCFLSVYILLADAEIVLHVENCARITARRKLRAHAARQKLCAHAARQKMCAHAARQKLCAHERLSRFECGINLKKNIPA